MFDIKTVPKIVIKENTDGKVHILREGNAFTLYVDGVQWSLVSTKSNLQLREFYSSYDLAEGNVLLSGFGFGILPQWIASKDNVKSVTVVELHQEVIDLFLKHNTLNPKIKIQIADIDNYQDDSKYNWVMFDHYELDRFPNVENLERASNNLNYDNLWFWSLEYWLLNYESWQKFRKDYRNLIPDLPLEQVKLYLSTVFTQKEIQIRQ